MRSLHTASAAALAATAVALAFPAIASGAPREWDIGSYDQCVADGYGKGHYGEEWTKYIVKCCLDSGGDWNVAEGKCQAPPAEQQASRPSIAHQGDLPDYTLEPSTPPATRIPPRVINQSIGTTS
jgi:hypothetical protein